MPERAYKVTIERKNPRYYQSDTSTKLVSRRSMLATVAAWVGYERTKIVKIEQSQPLVWEDVTGEFVEQPAN